MFIKPSTEIVKVIAPGSGIKTLYLRKTKLIVMMSIKASTNIVRFMASGSEVQALCRANMAL